MDETGKDLSQLFSVPAVAQSPPLIGTAAVLPHLEESLSAVVPTEELIISELFRSIDERPSPPLRESDLQFLPTYQAPAPQLEDSSTPCRVEPKTGENLNSGAQFKCPVCSTPFKKKKAMFGHMQIHSNKGSNGFRNPSNKKRKPKARPVPDLCELTARWTVTKKRSTRDPADRKVPVQVPASMLIAMSNSTWNCQSEKSEMDVFSPEEVEVAGTLKNMPNITPNCQSLKRRMPESEWLENKKRRIEESAPSEDKKYICKICNKAFPSHQALGGHCTSHKMLRKNAVSLKSAELQKNSEMSKNEVKENSDLKAHVCEMCGEGFSTGPKLGGQAKTLSEVKHSKIVVLQLC